MNYYQFNRKMLKRLMLWNLVNVGMGAILRADRDAIVKGIGDQAIAWGGINLLLVAFGQTSTSRQLTNREDAYDEDLMQKETNNLYRLLWINNRLNVLYVLSGFALASTLGRRDAKMRGTGIGIMIQGALLFAHDTAHIRKLKAEADL